MEHILYFCILVAAFSALKANARDNSHCYDVGTGGFEFGSQSPIELILSNSFICREKSQLKFKNYNLKTPAMLNNNGHTVDLKLLENIAAISGGPLPRPDYILNSVHFHWGEEALCGSEHVVENRCFHLEMHMVHYSSDCESLEEAIERRKVAVLAFFIHGDDTLQNHHEGLAEINDALEQVREFNSSAFIQNFSLSQLLNNDNCKSRFNYEGSLTTAPFSEGVNWIVCAQPIYVLSTQLRPFYALLNDRDELIKNNYRQLQPKGFRPVCRTNDKCPCKNSNKYRCRIYDNMQIFDNNNNNNNYNGNSGNGNSGNDDESNIYDNY